MSVCPAAGYYIVSIYVIVCKLNPTIHDLIAHVLYIEDLTYYFNSLNITFRYILKYILFLVLFFV